MTVQGWLLSCYIGTTGTTFVIRNSIKQKALCIESMCTWMTLGVPWLDVLLSAFLLFLSVFCLISSSSLLVRSIQKTVSTSGSANPALDWDIREYSSKKDCQEENSGNWKIFFHFPGFLLCQLLMSIKQQGKYSGWRTTTIIWLKCLFLWLTDSLLCLHTWSWYEFSVFFFLKEKSCGSPSLDNHPVNSEYEYNQQTLPESKEYNTAVHVSH